MAPDFIRTTAGRRPFAPFTLHLAGGRSLRVLSPEFIYVPAEGRMVSVVVPTGAQHVVDLLLVTDVEFSPKA